VFSAELDDCVREQRTAWEVPALVVGVRAGESQEVRGYGAPEDARFRIASLTKPFTATLVVGLALAGQLELEAPVLDGGVTLAHTLSHTTGLAGELPGGLERFGGGDGALEAAVGEYERVVRYADPGELWAYGNFGYWLAGASAARACGSTYEDALEQRVLGPLGLADTGFDLEPSLEGHDPYEPPQRVYPRARRPSGGLVSTAADLLRFAAFHLRDEQAAAAMRLPRIAALGSDWGLGWAVRGPVVAHDGNWGGFRSRLALVPEQGVAVVVLANSVAAGAAVDRIAACALRELAGVDADHPAPISLAPEALARFAGRYRAVDREYEVEAHDGGLQVAVAGEPAVLGRPVAPHEFAVLEGEEEGWHFDFPRPGLARFTVFAERVA
jgi:CubicO group peptidase (beta-lactamase class C family)